MDPRPPGIPNAELMARSILRKPTGPITRKDYESAFGLPYAEIWNPFAGSPLYRGSEGSLKRWEHLQRDIPSHLYITDESFNRLEIQVRRWVFALGVQGRGLLPSPLNPMLKSGSGFKLRAYYQALVQVYTPAWEAEGELLCDTPEDPGIPEFDWCEGTQGRLKDCTFIASIASLIRLNMFQKPKWENDKIRVKVGRVDQAVDYLVRWNPETGGPWDARGRRCKNGRTETWPALVEYAYRDHRHRYYGGEKTRDNLHVIEELWPNETLQDLTGDPVKTIDNFTAVDWRSLLDGNGGFTRPAVAWTGSSPEHITKNIPSFHSYSLVGALLDAANQPTDLVLRDPGGDPDWDDEVLDGAFERLRQSVWKRYVVRVNNGLLAIPIDRFWDWFKGISYVESPAPEVNPGA